MEQHSATQTQSKPPSQLVHMLNHNTYNANKQRTNLDRYTKTVACQNLEKRE